LCHSLTGINIPILTITSNVERCKDLGAPMEIDKNDFGL